MSSPPFDVKAPKRPTNLSLNSDLVRRARQLDINLSAEVERRLTELLREHEARAWRERNQRAIAEYNERVAGSGVFSDGRRRF